jgi:nucleotide-binding universal stress UspA family protein
VTYVAEEAQSRSLSLVGAELASWIAPTVGSRIRYRETITHGDAAEKVLDTAHYFNADLIVIGSQHQFFSDANVIGTTTQRVVRLSSVPVITVTQKAVALKETVALPEATVAV